ncbi:MAG TPA: alanine--tRNA ligase, partial [Dehalococcoidia bacterium]|nr:alanine--tRNA ligase [Dehalococcoidia bacterium]
LVSQLSGKKYGEDDDTDNAMRVVAEHGRGITFLIADGVMPDNEGRGYVLRRLLRRAALFGRRLGLDKPFLTQIAKATINKMGHIYPEIKDRRSFILKLIESEEARFGETLDTGLELLDGIMTEATGKAKKVSGSDVFKLYDTYGFPVELTCEIAQKKGFSVDMEGFKKEMEKQRERAKNSHRFRIKDVAGKVGVSVEDVEFVGYGDLRCKATIAAIIGDNPVDNIMEGQKADVVLDRTPFYAEMGGQVGDTGRMTGAAGRFVVTDTVQSAQGVTLHRGYVAGGGFSVGDKVEAIVDRERRLDTARNHTATHLLQYALRKVLGRHVHQRGSLVAPERLRFDFSHLTAMTQQELDEVQRIVNEEIRNNLAVSPCNIPYKQAIKEGAIALFDEKYSDMVRVLKIGEPAVSAELCGGTHVSATGQIGFFYILSESGIGGGLRRIEAVTGRGAEQTIKQRIDYLKGEITATEVLLEEERKHIRELGRERAIKEADSYKDKVEIIRGVPVNIAVTGSYEPELMREIADALKNYNKGIVVLGTVYQDKPFFVVEVSPELVKKGYHAGKIVKEVAAVTGGSGGGKATLAQGGGKDKSKMDEALNLVRSLV